MNKKEKDADRILANTRRHSTNFLDIELLTNNVDKSVIKSTHSNVKSFITTNQDSSNSSSLEMSADRKAEIHNKIQNKIQRMNTGFGGKKTIDCKRLSIQIPMNSNNQSTGIRPPIAMNTFTEISNQRPKELRHNISLSPIKKSFGHLDTIVENKKPVTKKCQFSQALPKVRSKTRPINDWIEEGSDKKKKNRDKKQRPDKYMKISKHNEEIGV